ncbi:MAG: hypothetical protein ACKV0T_27445 [Planctomycetales bacterium]
MKRASIFVAAAAWTLVAFPVWGDELRPEPVAEAEEPAAVASDPSTLSDQGDEIACRTIGTLDWHIDYTAAYRQARDENKLLFIVFRDEKQSRIADQFEREVLAHRDMQAPLEAVTRLALPVDAVQPPDNSDDPPKKLLQHSSFEHMYGRQGFAIIDLTSPRSELNGKLISAHPFSYAGQYSVWNTKIVLALPKATLTQRALIYAVRVHPAAPVSTTHGQCHAFLCQQARESSRLMSQYGSVGHHDWGTRSGAISAATGRSPQEVAAMGGNRELLDAAAEVVNQWHGSPAHWGIMSSPATIFGYDLVRGNGGWYGTGIFAY